MIIIIVRANHTMMRTMKLKYCDYAMSISHATSAYKHIRSTQLYIYASKEGKQTSNQEIVHPIVPQTLKYYLLNGKQQSLIIIIIILCFTAKRKYI